MYNGFDSRLNTSIPQFHTWAFQNVLHEYLITIKDIIIITCMMMYILSQET